MARVWLSLVNKNGYKSLLFIGKIYTFKNCILTPKFLENCTKSALGGRPLPVEQGNLVLDKGNTWHTMIACFLNYDVIIF